MKTIALLLIACFLVAGLSGCCGSQPPAFVWQPVPTFQQQTVTPSRTVTVPYNTPAVQYTYPTPAAPMAAPCR